MSLCPAYVQLMSSLCPKMDISYSYVGCNLDIYFKTKEIRILKISTEK